MRSWLLACSLALAAAATSLSCRPLDTTAPSTWLRRPAVHAVLLNGGGRPSLNFRSHLVHIEGFVGLLEEAGVPRDHVTIFSGDGSDPEADLATREISAEADLWLLPRQAQRALGPPIEYVDSRVPGYTLQPARREALGAWFAGPGSALLPGDTLLFYVTDHGNLNKEDLADNTITLWKEDLSVTQLREMLARLAPGVRVVMLMSQCFSGSFANAVLPYRDVCGYFASTADRPAYGCYPENRGVDGVGHSHHFLDALHSLGNLPEAQSRVLVTDDSPDVPHASSDFFLERTLTAAAGERGLSPFADELIGRAFTDRGRWEPEIRLLDRIGHTFGVFSPRSLAELDKQTAQLPVVSERLNTYADLWAQALDAAAAANLRAFVDAHPPWKEKLTPQVLKELKPEARAALRRELLAELAPFTRADSERIARMTLLRERGEKAGAARYRMEVRLGVLLRLRTVLLQIAGRTYLEEKQASADDRATYGGLRTCEDLTLFAAPSDARAADLAPPAPFPPLADEQLLVEAVMPAWMGIRYRPPNAKEEGDPLRTKGAVTVITVFDDSPAAKAGMLVGDIILGPPGEPFLEPNQVREWTMRREIGEPAPLRLRRGKRIVDITLHPGPFPLEMPSLPGPPKKGSDAPKLDLESFRGEVAPRSGRATLLFFWATWCAPCKAALTEVLAYADEQDVDVIAITDEGRDILQSFFTSFRDPFPPGVAMDPNREAFQSYGVSGTPTFVLIDAAGKIAGYQTGYNPEKGLHLE